MSAKRRQTVKDLIKLAVDRDTPDNERIAASMKACKLIQKYDLLSSPLDGFLESDDDTVRAASTIFETLTDPDLVNSVKRVAGRFGRRSRRR